jgi:hypothetical protein
MTAAFSLLQSGIPEGSPKVTSLEGMGNKVRRSVNDTSHARGLQVRRGGPVPRRRTSKAAGAQATP